MKDKPKPKKISLIPLKSLKVSSNNERRLLNMIDSKVSIKKDHNKKNSIVSQNPEQEDKYCMKHLSLKKRNSIETERIVPQMPTSEALFNNTLSSNSIITTIYPSEKNAKLTKIKNISSILQINSNACFNILNYLNHNDIATILSSKNILSNKMNSYLFMMYNNIIDNFSQSNQFFKYINSTIDNKSFKLTIELEILTKESIEIDYYHSSYNTLTSNNYLSYQLQQSKIQKIVCYSKLKEEINNHPNGKGIFFKRKNEILSISYPFLNKIKLIIPIIINKLEFVKFESIKIRAMKGVNPLLFDERLKFNIKTLCWKTPKLKNNTNLDDMLAFLGNFFIILDVSYDFSKFFIFKIKLLFNEKHLIQNLYKIINKKAQKEVIMIYDKKTDYTCCFSSNNQYLKRDLLGLSYFSERFIFKNGLFTLFHSKYININLNYNLNQLQSQSNYELIPILDNVENELFQYELIDHQEITLYVNDINL